LKIALSDIIAHTSPAVMCTDGPPLPVY